ncbi:MAG: hypothetical protein SF162_19400 [bacterium]|nr:hypothetical protein [bacterium]
MSSVLHTLREGDPILLPLLAQVWGVRIEGLDTSAVIDALSKAMLDPARAEQVWDTLGDKERGALQMLIASKGAKMAEHQFALLHGKIRKLSPKDVVRERPLQNPSGSAEALYYRGLVGLGYETAGTGPRAIVYIPEDLIKVLPTHKTSYADLNDDDFDEAMFDEEDDAPETDKSVSGVPERAPASSAVQAAPRASAPLPQNQDAPELDALPAGAVRGVRTADTSIVDDLTTLLAYLQLTTPFLERDFFARSDYDAIMAHLLIKDHARLVFMLGVGISARLIEIHNGRASTNREALRRWLNGTRAAQVRELAEAWKISDVWRDLFHVPGLHPEPEAGTLNQYSAAAARDAILEMLANTAPQSEWWSVEQFIEIVREESADFQRPNGDFESWYIRNDDGDYLSGIESWDAVEGALIEYVIGSPLHWLGMIDLADDAARLTAYGRGLLGITPFPNPPDPPDTVAVGPDGTITVSRKISRFERFQISRYTTWLAPADVSGGKPYTYKIDTKGINRAQSQQISVEHIGRSLSKYINPLPPNIARLLQNWTGGAQAAVSFEQVMIVRANAVEIMDRIVNTPATRRYLGARLGELAAIIRVDQWEALRDALGEMGIDVEGMA